MKGLIDQTLANCYRVDAFLGSGGMGTVYRVWDKNRAAYLALKVLRGDLRKNPDLFKRLQDEAEALSMLQHPHIVRSYGLEQDDSLAFILMDYIQGISLEKLIKEKEQAFALPEVIELFKPICTALHYAHSQGIVHCDVKPANILIDQNKCVLLTDFGLARFADERRMQETRYGGTPAYMSPEQVLRKEILPQSDIYALGVILFEMFTGGKRPFRGEQASFSGNTPEKVRWEHVYGVVPSLQEFEPSILPGLDDLVQRCLDKSPENRYASTLDVLNALQRINLGASSQPQPKVLPVVVSPMRDLIPARPLPPLQKPKKKAFRFSPFWFVLGFFAVFFVALLTLLPPINGSVLPDQDVLKVPDLDTVALEDPVMKPEPGQTYTYTLHLDTPKRLRWGYPWCATSQQLLEDNLSKMNFTFVDQNQQAIGLEKFSTFDYSIANTKVCRVYYRYVIENWQDGRYSLATDLTFTEPVFDGQDTYPAGTVRYRYDIQIGVSGP